MKARIMDAHSLNKKRIEWAKREIDILKENLFKGYDENSDEEKHNFENKIRVLDSCYDFVSKIRSCDNDLMASLAKNIVVRLLETKPLTPVGDTEDEWLQIAPYKYVDERLPGFFKKIDKMNTDNVTYHHNDRVICHNIETNEFYGFGLVNRVIDEMFPIVVPYYPYGQHIVKISEHLIPSLINEKSKGGDPDFNVIAIHNVIRPDYGPCEINRYFREPKKGEEPNYGNWVEIDADEYQKLVEEENKNDD